MRITIDGNVGAGKTTLATALVARLASDGSSLACVFEPVSEWERSGLLSSYYDGRIEALEFQKTVLKMYVDQWNATEADYVVSDRSELGHQAMARAVLAPEALNEYLQYYALVCAQIKKVDLRFVLEGSSNECMTRCRSRGRASESSLDLAWFQSVDRSHVRTFRNIKYIPVQTVEDVLATLTPQRSRC